MNQNRIDLNLSIISRLSFSFFFLFPLSVCRLTNPLFRLMVLEPLSAPLSKVHDLFSVRVHRNRSSHCARCPVL